jgi:acyl-CoA synthetase (AMP-forming)/AMP-acid ligase II
MKAGRRTVPGATFNFSSIVRHHAVRRGDREVLVDQGGARRITWSTLDTRVDAAAAVLRDAGIGPGDVVGLLLHNCAEFIEVIFAANRVGAVFLPLNWRLASEEVRYVLDHAQAKALVSEATFYRVLDPVLPALGEIRLRLALDPAPPAGWRAYTPAVEERVKRGGRVRDAEVGEDDLHRLMYTSGTTAHPKGVMLSYANLYWKNLAHILEFGLSSADRTLIVGPLYHVGALDLPGTGVLHAGGSLVILPRFDAKAVLGTIETERPTNVWLAPAMVNLLLQDPAVGDHDLSSIRLVIDGGEKMPMPLIRKLQTAFPGARFADAYGLTETVSGDTFVDKARVIDKIGSVGKPVAHLELRVVDDDGRDVPADATGEIVLRGPKVFKGYWRDPAATAAAIDASGWFHTGDIGRLDPDGYLHVVDRKKDMIISGGENIASLEVERVLYETPEVLECAVVGLPDPRWGEVPMAFVVLRQGQAVTAEALIASCEGKLAKFKIPREVRFIDALPRNPSGKVLKRTLRELLEA